MFGSRKSSFDDVAQSMAALVVGRIKWSSLVIFDLLTSKIQFADILLINARWNL
jgi:hypothetical protein